MTAVKIIRVMGTSEESWEHAAQEAFEQASETIEEIHGVKVVSQTADAGPDGLTEYKTTVEISFPVHHGQH